MHPTVFNQLKDKLYTRLTHHKYLLSVCGKTYGKLKCVEKPFPFEIDTVHEALTKPVMFINGSYKCSQPSDKPHYMIMMPVVLMDCHIKLHSLIIKFFNEACETDDQRARTTLIIGLNKRRGLDSTVLNRLDRFHREWLKPRFPCVILGFVWDPQYLSTVANWKYDVYKTFRILYLIDKNVAAAIQTRFNNTEVKVPYVNIRETIYTAKSTHFLFEKCFSSNPFYCGIADPDAKDFNRVIKGTDLELERFKEKNGDYPDVYSPGYEAPDDESDIIRIGLKIDRMIRTETSRFIGMGSYFSETFFIFRIKNQLSDFSFKSEETKKNQALESRRLYQNALRKGVIDSNKVHHGGEFPIITTVMKRMRTKFTEEWLKMDKENLLTLKALQCLCGLTYSHLSPREWANNLYAALPVKASNTQDVIQPLQNIYKAVHPIYAGYEFLGKNFSPDAFNQWLEGFDVYLSAIDNYWDSSSIVYPDPIIEDSVKDYEKFKKVIDKSCESLNKAFEQLSEAGLEVDQINAIYYAAYFSASKIPAFLNPIDN